MAFLQALRRAGIRALLLDDSSPLVEIDLDGRRPRFFVVQKGRAPYPTELDALVDRGVGSEGSTLPLLVAPYISEGLGAALTDRGWSWADSVGNYDLRAKGLRLRQRVASAPPPRPVRRLLPQGAGSLAIIRFLMTQSDQETMWRPTELADIAHVTQPRASQVLARLKKGDLAQRTPTGWHAEKEKLLDAFLSEYRGPGGSELPLYSLDEPLEVALQITRRFEDTPSIKIAISADVGPDLVASWRRPSHVIVYASAPIDIADLGLVQADGKAAANVFLRVPNDASVFRFPPLEVEVKDTSVTLADEAQMIWDLQDLGGDDRIEAAGRLRQWLLNPR